MDKIEAKLAELKVEYDQVIAKMNQLKVEFDKCNERKIQIEGAYNTLATMREAPANVTPTVDGVSPDE